MTCRVAFVAGEAIPTGCNGVCGLTATASDNAAADDNFVISFAALSPLMPDDDIDVVDEDVDVSRSINTTMAPPPKIISTPMKDLGERGGARDDGIPPPRAAPLDADDDPVDDDMGGRREGRLCMMTI
mmetsp:Transcript_4898/g.12298  ORF Transcript_4898/g.12298 Transcript_4898/m.12298 type:complete len:128 (+) Transcript_4898:211-594(+)